MFKTYCLLAAISWGIYQTALFCERETAGFTLTRISSDLPFNPNWETASLTPSEKESVTALLKQKFHYLGSGGQCFAFASEDGTTVLKFFKFHRRLPSFLNSAHKLQKKEHKLERDFNSYKIAFEELKEGTGMLFAHLNKTASILPSVTVVDKLGIAHVIPLDDKEFVLQKKADLVYTHFNTLMSEKNEEGAREAIHSLIQVVRARCEKGIFDEDAKIHRNFGFLGNQAIVIDVGRLRKDENRKQPEAIRQDLLQITERFKRWLEQHHPSLVSVLEEELEHDAHPL